MFREYEMNETQVQLKICLLLEIKYNILTYILRKPKRR